jgi:hypothetical protein
MWICPKCATHVKRDEVRRCPNCKATRSRDTTHLPYPEPEDIPPPNAARPRRLLSAEQLEIPIHKLAGRGFLFGWIAGGLLGFLDLWQSDLKIGAASDYCVGPLFFAFMFGLLGSGLGLSWHLLYGLFGSDKMENMQVDEEFSHTVFDRHPANEPPKPSNENITTSDQPSSTDVQP